MKDNDAFMKGMKLIRHNFINESFIKESNKIEGIDGDPTESQIAEHERFINVKVITIDEIIKFVNVYEPNAVIRDKSNLNVMVGNHKPPEGGQNIIYSLQNLLDQINDLSPFDFHAAYESLHPFTDCNGRSGRALWAWMMFKKEGVRPNQFLHPFYCQSLEYYRSLI